ncbi:MAG: hypothetical protein V7607_2576 [Solirubrobacteraceae bacterium]
MRADLVGYPQHALTPSATLYRIHSSAYGPWRFSKSGASRFDLTDGEVALGTCYLAETTMAAFVEVFRDFIGRPLSRRELEQRRLFSVSLPSVASLADVTLPAAQEFGLDASISAGTEGDYSAAQQFAHHCVSAGFAGIRYRVRHDLEQNLVGIALFGPALGTPHINGGRSQPIPDELLAEAATKFGFRFLGPLLEPLLLGEARAAASQPLASDPPPTERARVAGLDLGPACHKCGGMMQRTGETFTCPSCGYSLA